VSEDEMLHAFAEFRYEVDVREQADDPRRLRFRDGWADAAERDREYTEATLARLTWQNSGYRLGRRFGPRSAEEIDRAFDVLATRHRGAAGG
jgi:hypothetical protein